MSEAVAKFEEQKNEFILAAKHVGKKLSEMADHLHLINSVGEWLHCKTKGLEEIGTYYPDVEEVVHAIIASHEVYSVVYLRNHLIICL